MPRQAIVAKEFNFHAAHVLPNHDGPCRRLHGHTYRVEVAVAGRVKVADGSSDEGMVMDFYELKRIYEEHVEPLVEHQFLNETLASVLPRTQILKGEQDSPHRGVVATSENIALWMLDVFVKHLDPVADAVGIPRIKVIVKLWETPTSYAEVCS